MQNFPEQNGQGQSNIPKNPNKKVELPSFEYLMKPLKEVLSNLELAIGKLSLEIQLSFWQEIQRQVNSKVAEVQTKIDDERKSETAKENLILIAQFQKQFQIESSADLIVQMQKQKGEFREYLADENRKAKIVAYLCDILNEEFGGKALSAQFGFIKDVRFDAKFALAEKVQNPSRTPEEWQNRNNKINSFLKKVQELSNFKILFGK